MAEGRMGATFLIAAVPSRRYRPGMRTLLLALLACVAVLSACADGPSDFPGAPSTNIASTAELLDRPPFRFNITALPAAYQPWFQAAANEWNAATGKTLIVVDPQGTNKAVMGTIPATCDQAGIACTTWTNRGISTITFSNKQGWAECAFGAGMRQVAGHELGHALGAWFPNHGSDPFHSENIDDLMYISSPGCHGPTGNDIAAIPW